MTSPIPLLIRGTSLIVAVALGAPLTASAQPRPRVVVDTTSTHDAFGLLAATGLAETVRGRVTMRQPWSPFGISVDPAGYLVHDLTIEVEGLPEAGPGEQYVVWLATPSLDSVARIGPVSTELPAVTTTGLNKLLVLVTRETGSADARWRGPIVLRGRSRSALLQSLLSHSIFRRAEF